MRESSAAMWKMMQKTYRKDEGIFFSGGMGHHTGLNPSSKPRTETVLGQREWGRTRDIWSRKDDRS